MPSTLGIRTRFLLSLRSAIGDISFGFADGAISVAGLVFGVAAGTEDGSIVVLAGTTGAVAAAVSMMAGRYLDMESVAQQEGATLKDTRERVYAAPDAYLQRAEARLRSTGLEHDETAILLASFRRTPDALVSHVMAYEVGRTRDGAATPWSHAAWMFFAVLFAGCIPVVPFAILDIQAARIVSLAITAGLMVALGIMRGRFAGVNLVWSAFQTLAVAGVAAVAGITIGTLVSL
jgi:VIT1/CCC1 family predicted Fe2+/Mn2+ transporter